VRHEQAIATWFQKRLPFYKCSSHPIDLDLGEYEMGGERKGNTGWGRKGGKRGWNGEERRIGEKGRGRDLFSGILVLLILITNLSDIRFNSSPIHYVHT